MPNVLHKCTPMYSHTIQYHSVACRTVLYCTLLPNYLQHTGGTSLLPYIRTRQNLTLKLYFGFYKQTRALLGLSQRDVVRPVEGAAPLVVLVLLVVPLAVVDAHAKVVLVAGKLEPAGISRLSVQTHFS